MGQRQCSLENMEINTNFWKNRSVFLTGHTGFKGGWLTLWLTMMGAKVHGYSLDIKTNYDFFKVTNLKDRLSTSHIADILDFSNLKSAISSAKPSVIFHMAAQPLVLESYVSPIKTFETNVIGTVNLLEACRKIDSVEAIVNITTDKCYENKEKPIPYLENDKLGGFDPYSSSKACSELVTNAYRNSFLKESGIKIATVRAGNVVGGGDYAKNRLIPDFFRTVESGDKLFIRSPNALRPWQHVLEPLSGYILLAEKLIEKGNDFAEAWNFGPEENDAKTVSWVINYLSLKISNIKWDIDKSEQPHEATLLLLDSTKAKEKLGWKPQWSLQVALDKIVEWHKAYKEKKIMGDISISQINSYLYE